MAKKTEDFILVEGNELVSDFCICDHQVTQAEYESVMGTNPSYSKGKKKPVECVSWYDAVEYCNKLSEKEGLTAYYSGSGDDISLNPDANGYRLPTYQEWVYAAKGGNKSQGFKYSGSDNIDDVAWYAFNARKTQPVRQKQPNELGIYDMSGNVWEWCWDWFEENFDYTTKGCTGPEKGESKICLGGCFCVNGWLCEINFKTSAKPDVNNEKLGFRVVKASK